MTAPSGCKQSPNGNKVTRYRLLHATLGRREFHTALTSARGRAFLLSVLRNGSTPRRDARCVGLSRGRLGAER